MLSAPGTAPADLRHSLRNWSLVMLRLMASSSSTLTDPTWLPPSFDSMPGLPRKSADPTALCTNVTIGRPPAASLTAVSSRALSTCAIPPSVTLAGVPSGKMSLAWIRFASIFGKILNGVTPPRMSPTARIRIAAAPASTTNRFSIALSRAGAYARFTNHFRP